MPPPVASMLELRDLVVHYGAIQALSGVSLKVPQGQVVCVIGSNGAGKTTTLRTVSGLLRPTSGTITLDDKSLVGKAAHQIARFGVAHVPEGRHVFPDQSVEDNLYLGAFTRRGEGRAAISASIDEVYALFPRLAERRAQLAGTMSGGEQQMLAIGRALMLQPKLVLLDEPSMGLAPIVIDEVFRRLADLKKRGLTMLLVEQLAYRALDLADYAYVIEHGRIELEGPARSLRNDPRVRAAYLGEAAS
jgi:branched-chain amino acid transport system ATP-binding protein